MTNTPTNTAENAPNSIQNNEQKPSSPQQGQENPKPADNKPAQQK